MPYKLNEVNYQAFSAAASITPSCGYNTGFLDTSKAWQVAAWASWTASNFLVNSPWFDVHGAYDTNNPVLIFSSTVAANSGFLTMPASYAAIWAPGPFPFAFTRVRFNTTPVSSYPGSVNLYVAVKG